MKSILILSVLLYAIAFPAIGKLSPEDLAEIRLILTAELKPIRVDIASMKTDIATMKADIVSMKSDITTMQADIATMKADIVTTKLDIAKLDGRVRSVEGQLSTVSDLMIGLVALIVFAVGVPQIIMAWRFTSNREQARINYELKREIEALKGQGAASS